MLPTPADLSAHFPLLVEDEFKLLELLVPLRNATLVDVGCGAAQMTERMAREAAAAQVDAVEVDEIQLGKNRARRWPANVAFHQAGAESLPFADASHDGITLFKSLHHIPVARMDTAFAQMRRVLRPGGWVLISEPVFDGPFNEVMRLFHDEGEVRAAALAATERAVAQGLFRLQRRVNFFAPVAFKDFDDFHKRMMMPTHSHIALDDALVKKVRAAYEAHQTPHGAKFIRPMRIDVLART